MSVNKEVLDLIDFIDRFIIDYRNTPLKKRITSISYRLAVSKYLSIEYKLNTKINSDTEVTINEIIEKIKDSKVKKKLEKDLEVVEDLKVKKKLEKDLEIVGDLKVKKKLEKDLEVKLKKELEIKKETVVKKNQIEIKLPLENTNTSDVVVTKKKIKKYKLDKLSDDD